MYSYPGYDKDCQWISENAEMLLRDYYGMYIAVKDGEVIAKDNWLDCVKEARMKYSSKDFVVTLCDNESFFGSKCVASVSQY